MSWQTSLSLKPKAPFSFGHSLEFLRHFQADGITRCIKPNELRFALMVAGRPLGLRLESVATLESPELSCQVYAHSALSPELIELTVQHLRFYLSLDDALGPFYRLAQKDPLFKPVLARFHGYHQVKFPSLFCCACWALITQRTPNAFAYKTMAKLSKLLGNSLELEGQSYLAFPEPAAFLSKGSSAKILLATNNLRKTERLVPLAEAFSSADESWFQRAPYDEAARWLKGIPGLGQWSAEYILLRGLGRLERTPWSDTWMLGAISRVYTGGLQISRGDAKRLAESYTWYQGYWAHYLQVASWD